MPNISELAPMSPGEFLREEVLPGTGITQDVLAEAMGVSRYSVNQIINGKRTITAEMALRLSRVLSTTPDVWLKLQKDVDLYSANRKIGKEVAQLKVLRTAPSAFVSLDDLVTSEAG